MYKLNDLQDKIYLGGQPTSLFINLLKINWDKIHSEPNVFRYKIDKLAEIIVDNKYLLQLNPERSTNRRAPEYIANICQPFDVSKFNFTKVSQKEVMFTFESHGNEHSLLVNISPISQYHSLLCPAVNLKLPQVATADSLSLVLELIFLAQDCNLKIGFNSLCAYASVNHLHYHLLIEKHTLPVELVKWKHIKGPLHYTEDYPVPAFCFEVQNASTNSQVVEIYKLINYLLMHCIAHNILVLLRGTNAAVYVWPRKSTVGAKLLGEFNVAVLELSGWFPVYSADAFHNLQSKDLESELKKWKLHNFETLCREVELLY